MPGGVRRELADVDEQLRDPPPAKGFNLHVVPRSIDIAWASIGRDDLLPGELVFNRNDSSLVYRNGDANIRRFDSVATRTI